ncbi:Microtubule-nucleating Tub4p (gamma-tubulin) complex component [Malassezia pachydermatis]|uniref:Gamma-tubulin dgrip91 spc98 component n=1 Tax=Malassezia pachydermatis TaxID=77020 RepID=A0A0M9VNF9_9BASI|nr:gamma-tubulin dgrip91 spc98 component [Malassezia pachydermatis]KOS13309.1 gamma-tubulin dgrip91 spc98 component [Malassezia pachydermatis]
MSHTVVHVTALQQGERIPRAQLVAALRAHQGLAYVPEQALLRDVIYLLQGISGTHVRFKQEWQMPTADGSHPAETVLRLEFDEKDGIISPPTRDLIHRLAELGQLYVRVQRYVDKHTHPTPRHLASQSLCHFLAQELQAHGELVSDMEAQWHAQAEGVTPSHPLTLRRLVQTTREPILRMRLMSTMVESCRDMHGGALVSTIHAYTLTGDPFIRRCTSTLLDHVSRPFFHTLSRWIYDGELDDPFDEFFVAQASSHTPTPKQADDLVVPTEPGADAADVWQNRFVLRENMLPSFLSEHFARKIFSTGKSLHFLRDCCGEDRAEIQGRTPRRALRYSDMAGLEHAIDAEFALASGHLCSLFLTQFRLRDHLRAIKSYLLLTQGDFADALLQTLGPSLSRPASTLYQHNLSAALETAIRASNAQYEDPDILRRLDARSLEFGPGDTGWDTFTLEYRVEAPVNAVLDASAMAGYQLLFNYLWQINRVAAAVTLAWTQLLSTHKAVLRSRQRSQLDASLLPSLHRTLGHLHEMVHFVRQLQGFCELEGIAYAWQQLEQNCDAGISDLDQLIETHRHYLHTLIHTTLLRGRRGQADHLADDVRAQLQSVLAYAHCAEEWSHHITAELARLAGGVAPLRSAAHTQSVLVERLRTEHAAFQHRLQGMLSTLERHPTLTVRDLAVRIFDDSHTATMEF